MAADGRQELEGLRDAEGHVYSLIAESEYKPPYRSPVNIALLEDVVVGDFVLDARLQSTVKDYDHRSMVLVFGYQDPAHFYYVHFGKKTDNHANQIFIVNGAPRMKISTETTPGTAWDDAWHQVQDRTHRRRRRDRSLLRRHDRTGHGGRRQDVSPGADRHRRVRRPGQFRRHRLRGHARSERPAAKP